MHKKGSITILGISAFYHDSAAVLLRDGEVVAAAQEERFTRVKNDESFPTKAIKYCLKEGNVSLDELDCVVYYEKPFVKFVRLLETYYAFAPKGLKSFLSAIPLWLKEKLFLKKFIKDKLNEIEPIDKKAIHLIFSNHHLSHAASAFYPSPFTSAAILTIDAVGEWATATISHGEKNKIKTLKELRFPHSVGLLYSAFTYYLGFKVNSGEYKLMGLAPYGDPTSDRVVTYREIIKKHIVHIKEDGSIWLNQAYFDYATGLKMVNEEKWKALFGFASKKPESQLEQKHCDLALAIQQVTEEIVLKMAVTAKSITGEKNICLAGGVALNCVANSKLFDKKIFDDVWIQPASGDAGGALGAAYAAYYLYFQKQRVIKDKEDSMQGSYLGPEHGNDEIKRTFDSLQASYTYIPEFNDVSQQVANLLAEGKIIGWFQGRMEWGPRALGNRSIIADARDKNMQKKLNLQIKYREGFRPFAPIVLAEEKRDYFKIKKDSPYMLFVSEIVDKRKKMLPKDYHQLSVKEKLYFIRSDIPAVTHLDYSARLQTVHKKTNPRFWQLLQSFKAKTGYSLLVNTSFNRRGEPIVCTPEDAYRCFMKTELDYLVIGNFVFDKKKQKNYNENKLGKDILILD